MRMPTTYDNGRFRYWGWKLNDTTVHTGHDFDVDLGTPVYSVLPGTVVFNGHINGFGSLNPSSPGGVVIIQHKDKFGTPFWALYGHINSPRNTGETLAEGDVIGYVAPFKNGGDLLPHCHFGVYIGPGSGDSYVIPFPWGYASPDALAVWVDPRKFLTERCV